MELVLAVILLFSSLLVHEAGHWAALRRYHVPVLDFSLGLGPRLFRLGSLSLRVLPIGASVTPDAEKYQGLTPMKQFWVVLAGPWFSALYGSLLMLLSHSLEGAQAEGLWMLGAFNWFIAGVNLLPLPPLDGFRACVALLAVRGIELSPRMWRAANRIGNGLIYAVTGLVVGVALTELLQK
mgnify:CR=1 FL=1